MIRGGTHVISDSWSWATRYEDALYFAGKGLTWS